MNHINTPAALVTTLVR